MIPEDIKGYLKSVDQEVSITCNLGASVEDVCLSGKPLIDFVEMGAKVSLKMTLVSNFRSAIMEILKNDPDNKVANILMTMVPLAMCQLNGEIDVKF